MCVRSVCVGTESHILVREQHRKENTVKVEEQLTQLKRDAGLTFVKIAEVVGCARETIHKIKRDGKGDLANLEAIDQLHKQHFSNRLDEAPIEYGETVDLLGAPWDLWLARLTKRQGFTDPQAYLRHLIGQEHEAAFPDWPDVPGVAQRIEICGQDSTADEQGKNFPET